MGPDQFFIIITLLPRSQKWRCTSIPDARDFPFLLFSWPWEDNDNGNQLVLGPGYNTTPYFHSWQVRNAAGSGLRIFSAHGFELCSRNR